MSPSSPGNSSRWEPPDAAALGAENPLLDPRIDELMERRKERDFRVVLELPE